MSKPQSEEPNEVDDFCFPSNVIIGDECVQSPTMSLPLLDYHDLSTILDDPQEEEDHHHHHHHHDVVLLPSTPDESIDCLLHVHHGGEASTSGSPPFDSYHHHQVAGVVGKGSHACYNTNNNNNKKLSHNAKERVRRRNLNATYLALRSMLPHSKTPKEKWSAPYIIDKTLEYIPKLQAEVDKLTLDKSNILSAITNKQVLARDVQDQDQDNNDKQQTLTVSLNQVKKGEVIIQICQRMTDKANDFSSLLQNLEGQGIQILGASSVFPTEHRSCFHLHLQIGEIQSQEAADYMADLHKKLIAHLS